MPTKNNCLESLIDRSSSQNRETCWKIYKKETCVDAGYSNNLKKPGFFGFGSKKRAYKDHNKLEPEDFYRIQGLSHKDLSKI